MWQIFKNRIMSKDKKIIVASDLANESCFIALSSHSLGKMYFPQWSSIKQNYKTPNPGRLLSIGSLRVEHIWSDLAHIHVKIK